MNITSTSFYPNQCLSSYYGYSKCEGSNYSPSLEWSIDKTISSQVRSYAIVMYDTDAYGGFLHWLVYNIPPSITSLPEMKNGIEGLTKRAISTTNDFGEVGYGGPCSSSGKPHRYEISIYGLSKTLSTGLSSREVIRYVNDTMVAKGKIITSYSR